MPWSCSEEARQSILRTIYCVAIISQVGILSPCLLTSMARCNALILAVRAADQPKLMIAG